METWKILLELLPSSVSISIGCLNVVQLPRTCSQGLVLYSLFWLFKILFNNNVLLSSFVASN